MRRLKLFLIIAGLFFVFPVLISAQTAAELEALLETPAVSYDQAARFVLLSGNPAFEGNAYEQAVANGWLKNSAPDSPVTLGNFSFLIMKTFDMKGGMMYSFFPGPRYAFRSMVSRSYIQGAADPSMTISGEQFLLILGKVLSAEGDGL